MRYAQVIGIDPSFCPIRAFYKVLISGIERNAACAIAHRVRLAFQIASQEYGSPATTRGIIESDSFDLLCRRKADDEP